ncbi:MAG: hypothetical protein ACRDVG_05230 [Jatrophihabitantaceae bacterium]
MGRHSAPDAPEPDPADGATEVIGALDLAPRSGRHSTDGAPHPDEQHTQRIAIVDADGVAPATSAAAAGLDESQPAQAKAEAKAAAKAERARAKQAKKDARAARKKAPTETASPQAAPTDAEEPAVGTPAILFPADASVPAAAEPATKRESDTKADLRILRQNGAVRAQAIGAVIVAFLLYTLVMLAIGRGNDFAKWIWIPIVVAGVLVGLVLDLGHRRAERSSPPGSP